MCAEGWTRRTTVPSLILHPSSLISHPSSLILHWLAVAAFEVGDLLNATSVPAPLKVGPQPDGDQAIHEPFAEDVAREA
jgi:hypothetical protein